MADAGDEASHRLSWQPARIEALEPLSPTIRRVVLRPQRWWRPLAGQHLDVRLTAEDGYQAQRSYSLLSPPERDGVYELGVERLAEGEVSPWFHDAAQVGESLEILGPVGGHFVWRVQDGRPTLLIGGGSGVVPLLAMAAHRVQSRGAAPMVLVVAARTMADVLLWPELQRWEAHNSGFQSRLALSRESVVERAQDHAGRIREVDLAAALQHLGDSSTQSASVYVCGSNAFVESAITMLRALQVPDQAIRTERFGG
ncbi:MAG TPA: FAD-binding oxidoreductase [Aquabacterium sp.]|jgi:ferredoxin-NADP reductase|nr:FAD-binding oxidoreductase [Piscinibacter sp.]HPM64638.1 FAD-binding oxidoreductase [Piscinibacter sp.]HQC94189.1 FAD-binding oxidoreductase [Aquabacterium sp.]